jgi:hypothetical protein
MVIYEAGVPPDTNQSTTTNRAVIRAVLDSPRWIAGTIRLSAAAAAAAEFYYHDNI